MSPGHKRVVGIGDGFPRVSGDEPVHHALRQRGREFSPRERG